jgi:cell division protein FtsL
MGRAATAAAARPEGTTVAGPGGAQNRYDHRRARTARSRLGGRRARATARSASGRSALRLPAAALAGLSSAGALPIRVVNAPFARTLRARTTTILDALLSGRGWIALIGVLLAGIVFFNVDLLQMNRDIARDAEKASALGRENARLRLTLARLGSSERIQEAAAGLGLVLPAPGEVRYLKARPELDARRAAKRITAPNDTLMPPAPEPTAPTTTTPPTTTTAPPTTTPPAATTTTPPAATTTTPPATTAPPATTTPPATTASPTTTPPASSPQPTTPPTIDPATGQPIG